MRGLKPWSIAATLMAIVSASAASANPPPDLDDEEPEAKEVDKNGGNAIDKTSIDRASLPPGYYEEMGDFWALFVTGADPFLAGAELANIGGDTLDPPQLILQAGPTDAPAESVLDEIDESQAPLPMVGEAGSQATVAGAEPTTPPPESILDYIDQPAPPPAGPQDAVKPAANQAPRPAVAPPPPPP